MYVVAAFCFRWMAFLKDAAVFLAWAIGGFGALIGLFFVAEYVDDNWRVPSWIKTAIVVLVRAFQTAAVAAFLLFFLVLLYMHYSC